MNPKGFHSHVSAPLTSMLHCSIRNYPTARIDFVCAMRVHPFKPSASERIQLHLARCIQVHQTITPVPLEPVRFRRVQSFNLSASVHRNIHTAIASLHHVNPAYLAPESCAFERFVIRSSTTLTSMYPRCFSSASTCVQLREVANSAKDFVWVRMLPFASL